MRRERRKVLIPRLIVGVALFILGIWSLDTALHEIRNLRTATKPAGKHELERGVGIIIVCLVLTAIFWYSALVLFTPALKPIGWGWMEFFREVWNLF